MQFICEEDWKKWLNMVTVQRLAGHEKTDGVD